MDDYISVGFVFRKEKLNQKTKIFENLLHQMNLHDYSVLVLSIDTKDNQQFIYKNMTDADYQKMTAHDYINVLFMCSFLGIKNQMINITFYTNDDYFGIIVDLFVNPFKKGIDYEQFEVLLIEYIKESYYTLSFDYALCQIDGVEQISPDEILDADMDFCFLAIPNKDDMMIKQGEYRITGEKRSR